MNRPTLLVIVLVGALVALVWTVALASQATYAHDLTAQGPVVDPLAVPLGPDAAGVATWAGLGAVVLAVTGNVHVLRRGAPAGAPRDDDPGAAPHEEKGRRVLERLHPPDSWTGLGLLALFVASTLLACWAFLQELGGLHRASLLGIYGAVALASLAEVVTVYGGWFVPRTVVAEPRDPHAPRREGSP